MKKAVVPLLFLFLLLACRSFADNDYPIPIADPDDESPIVTVMVWYKDPNFLKCYNAKGEYVGLTRIVYRNEARELREQLEEVSSQLAEINNKLDDPLNLLDN
jgi:hypothetical protein